MTRIVLPLAVLATTLAIALPAIQAQAQSIRTFVSTTGTDNSSCSITAPCRHFQAAVNATALGGEVDALDAGAYGSFIISQAISIEGQGWSYVAPGANGNAITINTVSGNVSIRGVSLNGVGTNGGTNGIVFNSGGNLTVRDSVIRNFSGNGINFIPNSSSPCGLSVSNTLISDNESDGIDTAPTGTGAMTGVLDHVNMENNGGDGLDIATSTQTINFTVNDSVSSNNADGITAFGVGVSVSVMVRNSTIANNTGAGLLVGGSGGRIKVTRSTITGNAEGWQISDFATGGLVSSYADNNIDGNGGNNSTPGTAIPYH